MRFFVDSFYRNEDKQEISEADAVEGFIEHSTENSGSGQIENLEASIDGLKRLIKTLILLSPNKDGLIRHLAEQSQWGRFQITIEEEQNT